MPQTNETPNNTMNDACQNIQSRLLSLQDEAALPYLTQERLEKWTHNKTIQKAVESYRIDDEQKAFLRTLRLR